VKKKSTRLRDLLHELRYWQMMYRLELKGLERIRERILKIAAQMREVQKEEKK